MSAVSFIGEPEGAREGGRWDTVAQVFIEENAGDHLVLLLPLLGGV